jgi:hypothetical protein
MMGAPDKNISTENQPKGSARNLSDTLDREGEHVPSGQRQWSRDSAEKPDFAEEDGLQNATSRPGAEAAGG